VLIDTVNRLEETTVVERGDPFHFTTAPPTKPVPFTVRENAPLPGLTVAGTSGWFTSGTGLFAASRVGAKQVTKRRENNIWKGAREKPFMEISSGKAANSSPKSGKRAD
jgi:hypothetical protein